MGLAMEVDWCALEKHCTGSGEQILIPVQQPTSCVPLPGSELQLPNKGAGNLRYLLELISYDTMTQQNTLYFKNVPFIRRKW
jgi:hypothetical protein